ncbi:MAG TPA: AAA family ATPase [Verrucomicrobiales bacterium]|nr:AAA family ATPase [Verrucomicrobiales bacterium]
MILHRVQVAHWRSLLDAAELGPFSKRITVIHAPNGTGKSSVFEAVRRALFDSHQVGGQEIEAVRPWGRALAPQVEVEFSRAQVRYRVQKRFLDHPSAKLLRLEDGRFVPLAEGRQADVMLRDILGAAGAPGRGLSKPEHWGWAQALWAPQGSLRLDSLSSSLTENLRAALGAQVADESGTRLEQLIRERYASYYAAGGKLKRGKHAPALTALQAELPILQMERQRWLSAQEAYEQASRNVEDARNRRAQALRESEELRNEVDAARRQLDLWTRIQAEIESLRLAEKSSAEHHKHLEEAWQRIADARTEVAALEQSIAASETDLAVLTGEQKGLQLVLEQAQQDKQQAETQRAAERLLSSQLHEARDFLEETHAAEALRRRTLTIREREETIRGLKRQRSALVAPSKRQLAEIRKLHSEIALARAALDASRIRLRVSPRQDAVIRHPGEALPRHLSSGETTEFTGSPSVEIEIDGFGTVRASGPEGESPRHEAALASATGRLVELTQCFPSPDPEPLQRILDEATGLERRIHESEERLGELLECKEASQWDAGLAALNASLQQRLARFPEWASQPPSVPTLQTAHDELRRQADHAVQAADAALERARNAFAAAGQRCVTVEATLGESRRSLETARRRLVQWTQDGKSDLERQNDLNGALMSWNGARTLTRQAQKQLEAIPADPAKALAILERQLEALHDAEARARDEENTAIGRLHTHTAEGSYSKLAACEERIAALEDRIARESLQMEAVRLLHDTVAELKAAAVAAVAAPVERAASRMIARIAGPKLGTIALTEGFVPGAFQPIASDRQVDLDNLSGGEQEQLFLVSRLALGEVLAQNERQLVVLDDVLNATDTGRLARVLDLLEDAAEHLQIVILTCHPERYRALNGAEFLELKPQ